MSEVTIDEAGSEVGRVRNAVSRLRPSRATVLVTVYWIVGIGLVKVLASQLTSHNVLQASTPLPVIVLGSIIGLTYGLLAVGLVLIYRVNRIINFAHGQIGAFAAAFFALAVITWHLPYWAAFVIALLVASGVGAGAELGVVRRLRRAPALISIVATLGLGSLLLLLGSLINISSASGITFPEPAGLPSWNFGALVVTPADNAILFLSPVVVFALAVFLKRSRFGLAMRAAADNSEAARMAGMFASRMSTLGWAMAGVLSAFTAILVAPTQGFQSADSYGPGLLLRAMVPFVLARGQSLPKAVLGGVGLGILEQLLLWNYPSSGLVEASLFVIILFTLLVQRDREGRDLDKGGWSNVQIMRPLPGALQRLWPVRNLGLGTGVVLVGFLALLPLFIGNAVAVNFTTIIALSIVGISVGLLSGLGGQMTLGAFAIAAVGAVVSYKVSSQIGDFPVAFLVAAAAAGIASVLLGLPALRIRGQMLSVTTLAFALAAPAWLLVQPWALGDGQSQASPSIFGYSLATGRSYYYFALVVLAIMLVLVANLRRGGFGRLLVAVRDGEDNARAFAVSAWAVKLKAFFIAGCIAGIGGAVYGTSLSNISAQSFPTQTSIDLVTLTVVGGIGLLAGPIIGCIWIIGLPLLNLGNTALFGSSIGALFVILYNPGGILSFAEPVRNRIVSWLGARRGLNPAALFAGEVTESEPVMQVSAETMPAPLAPRQDRVPGPLLRAVELRRTFGGVVAVDDVSLEVSAGETLGMIGPNGAGKTTTFELLSGYTRPEIGRVIFGDRDVTRMSPEARARLGLIRSFQDAALFPTMTVQQSIMVALERVEQTSAIVSTLGFGRRESRKAARSRELLAFMGLERYADRQIRELSTGTRRIAEIACLLALEPVVLLLDEPSSGIAQRETEALGELLVTLKRELDLTLLVIEHDIPLIMGISDRIVAMADGRIIASGSPAEVRANPLVIEAYLGGSVEAIERSGR